MGKAVNILMQDPRYLKMRRRELQLYLDMFSRRLAYIFTIMPAPKRIYHFKTKEWEVINDPQWQSLIDKITEEQNRFLENNFPEFYTKS